MYHAVYSYRERLDQEGNADFFVMFFTEKRIRILHNVSSVWSKENSDQVTYLGRSFRICEQDIDSNVENALVLKGVFEDIEKEWQFLNDMGFVEIHKE